MTPYAYTILALQPAKENLNDISFGLSNSVTCPLNIFFTQLQDYHKPITIQLLNLNFFTTAEKNIR